MKNFEWDENKRDANLQKHGIDFIDAIQTFKDLNRIEAKTIRKNEERYKTIGIVNSVALLVVYTLRNGKKRIISARRASKEERNAYEEKN